MVFGYRAGCDNVALGRHGQPRGWLDEVDGHGAQGPEIGATARAGRRHGFVGTHRQVRRARAPIAAIRTETNSAAISLRIPPSTPTRASSRRPVRVTEAGGDVLSPSPTVTISSCTRYPPPSLRGFRPRTYKIIL